MSTSQNEQRPTPETDSNRRAVEATIGHTWLCDYQHACKLEQERDEARKQLEALREAIKEAHEAITKANDLLQRAGREDGTTWEPGQSWIFWEDKCSAKNDVESIRAALTKLQPFIKP